jgi:hypothetical protein
MARVRTAGSTHLVPLLLLLLLLCGYGVWNYQRNLEAEAAMPRPYKGYTDEQLDQLAGAYQGQVDALNERYDAASGKRSDVRDAQLLGDAVDEFQRVQRKSRAVRELGARASQEQASLQAIQDERAIRAKLGSGWTAFLRRAFMPPG